MGLEVHFLSPVLPPECLAGGSDTGPAPGGGGAGAGVSRPRLPPDVFKWRVGEQRWASCGLVGGEEAVRSYVHRS